MLEFSSQKLPSIILISSMMMMVTMVPLAFCGSQGSYNVGTVGRNNHMHDGGYRMPVTYEDFAQRVADDYQSIPPPRVKLGSQEGLQRFAYLKRKLWYKKQYENLARMRAQELQRMASLEKEVDAVGDMLDSFF